MKNTSTKGNFIRQRKRIKAQLTLFGLAVIVVGLATASVLVQKSNDGFWSKASISVVDPSQKKVCQEVSDTGSQSRLTASNCVTISQSYRRWKDWYPIDYGQPENYRVINYWSSAGANQNEAYHGVSTLNVPDSIPTLPVTYNGNKVNYFFNYQCRPQGGNTDPRCYNTTYHLEILSEGSAVDTTGDTTLEHWSFGGDYNNAQAANVQWYVMYDQDKIGADTCNGQALASSSLDLERADLKKPWVLKLPIEANTYFQSDPVCVISFSGYSQNNQKIIDSRTNLQGRDANGIAFETGNWITITVVHEVTQEATGRSVVRAENIYLSDNSAASNRFNEKYCRGKSDALHCPNGTPLSIVQDNRTYAAFAFEEYYMRKSESTNYIIDNKTVPIINKFGFGAFKWFSARQMNWDRVTNTGKPHSTDDALNQQYQVEKCSLNSNLGITSCAPVQVSPPTARLK